MSAQSAMRIWQPESYKERIVELFNRRAPGYDDRPAYHLGVVKSCLKYAKIQKGNAVLDLACGTGHLALQACESVGPEGMVVGLDISQPMIDRAREKADAQGVTNLTLIVADAESHHFQSASFDVIAAANAVPYMQHYPASFKAFHSWLRPGGRFVFSTPQTPMFQATDTLNELAEQMFGLKLCDAAGEVGDKDTAQQLLLDAGFAVVKVNPEDEEYVNTKTPDEFAEGMWTQSVSFPMCPLDKLLDEEQLMQLKAAYIPLVVEQGKAMQEGKNIVNNHIQYYIVASA